MNNKRILVPAIAGTTLMTAFSYMASVIAQEKFSEPELLAALEKPMLPGKAEKLALPAGWLTHYSIGVVWLIIFEYLWRKTPLSPSVKFGTIAGIINGITGIVMWKSFFKIHPRPPRTHYKRFYQQLLAAHIIFSIVASVTAKKIR